MRIFLDECVDWRLARELAGHEVKSAREMGWTAIKNGDLLALVSTQFDVFLTVDRNLAFQQNIPSLSIAVVILQSRTSRLADLKPLVPLLLARLETIEPGQLQVIKNH